MVSYVLFSLCSFLHVSFCARPRNSLLFSYYSEFIYLWFPYIIHCFITSLYAFLVLSLYTICIVYVHYWYLFCAQGLGTDKPVNFNPIRRMMFHRAGHRMIRYDDDVCSKLCLPQEQSKSEVVVRRALGLYFPQQLLEI